MKTIRVSTATVFALLAVLLVSPAVNAQESATEVGTDIGTLYPDEVAPLYKAPGYSPLPVEITRRAFFGATPIFTPRIR
jgi:hypothetical protein